MRKKKILALLAGAAVVGLLSADRFGANPRGLVILFLLAIGSILEPVRLCQAAKGSLYKNPDAPDATTGKAIRFFCWAFPFWLALLWAAWNIHVVKSCSGDNCIGYMLFSMPFPFLYGIGEILLLEAYTHEN